MENAVENAVVKLLDILLFRVYNDFYIIFKCDESAQ